MSTQRAYTLRLDGAAPGDDAWRERLWLTHEKVNDGARAFGDFLLTLRGGVAAPTDAADKAQRRLLALCWFSVESKIPETQKHLIQIVDRGAFFRCLKAKGIPESKHNSWWEDCKDALTASIRDDAVRVERWRLFEEMKEPPSTREIEAILSSLLGREFLKTRGKKEDDGDDDSGAPDEQAEGRVIKAARSMYGRWFGEGGKSDFRKIGEAFKKLAEFAADVAKEPPSSARHFKERVLGFRKSSKWAPLRPKTKGHGQKKSITAVQEPALAKPGPSKAARRDWERVLLSLRADSQEAKPVLPAEFGSESFWENISQSAKDAAEDCLGGQTGPKSGQPWQNGLRERLEEKIVIKFGDENGGKANTEFCRLMLSEAAKRLSQTHSWARRQELERLESEKHVQEKGARFGPDGDGEKAAEWLKSYLADRGERSGALGSLVIAKNALDGWEDIVKAWKSCKNAEERKNAVRELQAAEEKFGDANLFRDLAEDDALCTWQLNGKPDKTILSDYAAWTRAQESIKAHKVPSYRHPDALEHPIFCEFGNSRPSVRYGWQIEADIPHQRAVDLLLLDERGRASVVRLRWRSARLARELGLGGEAVDEKTNLSRNTRLGRQAAGDFPHGCLDRKMPAGVLASKDEKLNARLQVDRGELATLARLTRKSPRQADARRQRLPWFVTMSPELTPSGPWLDFIRMPTIIKLIDSRRDSPVWKPSRKNPRWDFRRDIGWLVRPGLGTLPGIRVLGVDLGQRYGAIGSIWQQVSMEDVQDAAKKAGISKPEKAAVAFRCPDPTRPKLAEGKREGEYPELIFRRVGDESWARLERQFLIRLPGGERG